jgi:hypothetical protein
MSLVHELLAEVVPARAATFDLDEVGRRKDRAEESEIEQTRALLVR